MMDTVDRETRSRIMAGIRDKNTQPEMIVRKFLHSRGFRYRLHDSSLPGTPDIVFSKYRTVIFINGCFWHRHQNCRYASTPKSNTSNWNVKLTRNAERDVANLAMLLKMGWRVIVVWECGLRKGASITLGMLVKLLQQEVTVEILNLPATPRDSD